MEEEVRVDPLLGNERFYMAEEGQHSQACAVKCRVGES